MFTALDVSFLLLLHTRSISSSSLPEHTQPCTHYSYGHRWYRNLSRQAPTRACTHPHTRTHTRAQGPHVQSSSSSSAAAAAALSLGGRGRAPIMCLAAASGVVLAAPRLAHYHLLALQPVRAHTAGCGQ